jgi:DUF1680 family protein
MTSWNTYREQPLSSISPEGWLREFLEVQRHGLTGHLEAAGYPFNTKGWATPVVKHETGTYWWPYEQMGYWVDGLVRCGRLIGDPFLVQKAKTQIDYTLDNVDEDGYLGPSFLKTEDRTQSGWQYSWNRWPHVVFFRAMMAEYGATGDKRILDALHKHYLATNHSHSDQRDALNIEILVWVYHQTGDARMLQKAREAFDAMNERAPDCDTSLEPQLSSKRPTEHGVSYCESAKLGAILYGATGEKKFLQASVNAIRKMERFSMLVDGIPSSSEKLRGKDSLDSHETCVISDFTWTCGYLLMATGDVHYADLIERACFNAGPGAVKKDFRAAQYFSCPNQVVSDKNSNHNLFCRGHIFMRFAPNPATECCSGNMHRFMPNYAARMWMQGQADEVVAAFYGPSRLTTEIAGTPVTLVEETNYPFSDRIEFQVRTPRPVAFTLTVRIPGWCRNASVLINGRPIKQRVRAGTFVPVRHAFENNDRVTVVLPMQLKLTRWPHDGVAVERGPLVYSLGVKERWVVDPSETQKATKEFPAWGVYAESPWNYALDLDEKTLAARTEIVEQAVTGNPWQNPPVMLRVPARRVRGWSLEKSSVIEGDYCGEGMVKKTGTFVLTPQLPDPKTLRPRLAKRQETITLVPYGATHLRITVFPQAK